MKTARLVVLAVLASAYAVYGHLMSICTHTSPSKPGRLNVMFGTYHANLNGKTAPGVVTLTDPGGNKYSGGFTSIKGFTISKTDQMPAARTKILNAYAGEIPADSQINCYSKTGEDKIPPAPPGVHWGVPILDNASTIFNGYYTRPSILAMASLTIDGASSGNWGVSTSGTDVNFAPCRDSDICRVSTSYPIELYNLEVADGGAQCTNITQTINSSVTQSTVAACRNTNSSSGSICSNTCATASDKMVGKLQCVNGTFMGNPKCYSSLTGAACDASVPPANSISLGTCGSSLASGQSCLPVCKPGFFASNASTCLDGKFTPTVCAGVACTGVQAPKDGALGSCPSDGRLSHGAACTPKCTAPMFIISAVNGGQTSCDMGTTTMATCVRAPPTPVPTPTPGPNGTLNKPFNGTASSSTRAGPHAAAGMALAALVMTLAA
jgi:hypothetical protein